MFMYMYIHVHCTGPGIAEGDENCKKFLEKTMPDAFHKVQMCIWITMYKILHVSYLLE